MLGTNARADGFDYKAMSKLCHKKHIVHKRAYIHRLVILLVDKFTMCYV